MPIITKGPIILWDNCESLRDVTKGWGEGSALPLWKFYITHNFLIFCLSCCQPSPPPPPRKTLIFPLICNHKFEFRAHLTQEWHSLELDLRGIFDMHTENLGFEFEPIFQAAHRVYHKNRCKACFGGKRPNFILITYS